MGNNENRSGGVLKTWNWVESHTLGISSPILLPLDVPSELSFSGSKKGAQNSAFITGEVRRKELMFKTSRQSEQVEGLKEMKPDPQINQMWGSYYF